MNHNTDNDPFMLLSIEDDRCWPPSADPRTEAISAFDPAAPKPLIDLLHSADPLVVKRGLFVFGSLGNKALIAVDAAIESVGHPDMMARSALMDGLLCYTRGLTLQQISCLLPLCEDPEGLVRDKMIALLGAISMKTLRAAIDLIENDVDRVRHLEAFDKSAAPFTSSQEVFDAGMKGELLVSTYMLASIERAARHDEHTLIPNYDGIDYVGTGVIAQTKRLVAGTRRRRAKQRSRK